MEPAVALAPAASTSSGPRQANRWSRWVISGRGTSQYSVSEDRSQMAVHVTARPGAGTAWLGNKRFLVVGYLTALAARLVLL